MVRNSIKGVGNTRIKGDNIKQKQSIEENEYMTIANFFIFVAAWFIIVFGLRPRFQNKKRRCRGSNPGRPRDRRKYLPLYYNDYVVLQFLIKL